MEHEHRLSFSKNVNQIVSIVAERRPIEWHASDLGHLFVLESKCGERRGAQYQLCRAREDPSVVIPAMNNR
jgi:hypothetical protein